MPPSSNGDAGSTPQSPAAAAPQQSSSRPSDPYLSPSEARYVLDGCLSGCRVDGRGPADYRPYSLDSRSRSLPPPSSSAGGGGITDSAPSRVADPPLVLSHGSARVSLPGGGTDVLCSVRAELVRPSPRSPGKGSVDVRVEMLHPSSSSSSRGRRRAEEAELTAALTRLVCPLAADWEGLCILPGRYAWRLACDVTILSSDGSALDASAMAMRAAMRGTLLPVVTPVVAGGDPSSMAGGSAGAAKAGGSRASDDLIVDGDMARAVPPPGADDCPVLVTVSIMEGSAGAGGGGKGGGGGGAIGGRVSRALLLDACSEEERCASTSVAVGVDLSGRICGVYKRGSGTTGGEGGGTLPLAVLGEVAVAASEGARRVLRMTDGEGERSGSKLGGGGAGEDGGGIEDMLGGHLVIR